jgi:hypothetical protein
MSRESVIAGRRGAVNPLDADLQDADARRVEAAEKVEQARKREFTTAKALAAEETRAANARLTAINQERSAIAETIRLRTTATQSARERFGSLGAQTRAQLVAIKRKADAGGRLTREEENQLAQFSDVGGIGDIVGAGRSRRAEASGFGEFAGAQAEAQNEADRRRLAQQDQAAQQEAGNLQATLSDISRNIRAEIVVRDNVIVELKTDDAALVDEVTRQTAQLLDERMETMRQQINDRFEEEAAAANAGLNGNGSLQRASN